MIVVLYLIWACCYYFPFSIAIKNSTTKLQSDEDYYLSYDYELNNNNSKRNSEEGRQESLIIPNPDSVDGGKSYAVDVLPDVELPDDSLADPDLKDHNCIDNIMYVYYGGKGKNSKSYGRKVMVVGSILNLILQLLTALCVFFDGDLVDKKSSMILIVLHIYLTMLLANFLSTLIYKTDSSEDCLLRGILANILNHHTAIWIFLYCLYIYKKFSCTWISIIFHNTNWLMFVVHFIPPIITMTTYFAVPNSFETKKFCFKSMHRGMIFNFMIPICGILILTTAFAISAMIKIECLEVAKLDYHYQNENLNVLNNKELESLKERKDESIGYVDEELSSLRSTRNCLKSLCFMQLIFVLNWFITPEALDASLESTELPYVQCATSAILNWFVFYKRKTLLPQMDYTVETSSEKEICDDEECRSSTSTELISIASSDNIPLLKADSATELKEFCSISEVKKSVNDYHISTIST